MKLEIFKAYDVRGIYKKEIDEKIVELIGKAFVTFFETKKIVVGRDMRISGEKLSKAFIKGATSQGADVVDVGLVSTDALYFASGHLNLPGIMFTASHNPPKYNGIKFCKELAEPINYETGLKNIEKLVKKKKFPKSKKIGKVTEIDILPEFAKHVLKIVDTNKFRKLRIAVDAGNGMAGKIVPLVFDKLKPEIFPLYFKLDGKFPNHLADPTKYENLKDLQRIVKRKKCHFGMAFDGDADRIFFIDEKAQIINASLLSCLVIEEMLNKSPYDHIIYNLVNSKIVPEVILKNKGMPIRERVGHSFIKQTMKNTNSVFGCEHSAHYYYRDNFNADSGIITALIVTKIISEKKKKLSVLIKKYQKYFKIEEESIKVKDKKKKMKEIEMIYRKKRGSKLNKLDGFTIEFKDWWFNIRPSNTEPLLRLNLEANSKELMVEKSKEIIKLMKKR